MRTLLHCKLENLLLHLSEEVISFPFIIPLENGKLEVFQITCIAEIACVIGRASISKSTNDCCFLSKYIPVERGIFGLVFQNHRIE